ncbi:MAG: hypothetical protein EPO36_05490 [Chloroflexota bacterium]|nr:MAG: hypothetical protein EPO36_05490 [Chloroflexota bacterium]
MFDSPIVVALAAVMIAVIVVLAVRRPATRRWLAAGFAIGLGLLVAFYAVIIGALAQMDASGGFPPAAIIVAVIAAGAGLGVGTWIVRAGRSAGTPPPASTDPD